MFVSPTHSEIRIYQDVNRGSRIGNGSKVINHVVQFFLKDEENHFNNMFARIKIVGEALEVGIDEITEQVIFKQVRNIPKGKKMSRQSGADVLSYYDEIDADFFANSFNTYIKEGRYHKFGEVVNNILDDCIMLDQTLHGYLDIQSHKVNKEIFQKYKKEFFSNYSKGRWSTILQDIREGKHFLLSDDNVIRAINWQLDRESLKIKTLAQIKTEFENSLKVCAFIGPSEIGSASNELSKKYNYGHRLINNMRTDFDLDKIQKNNQDKVVKLYKNNYKKFNYLDDLDKWVHAESNKAGIKISLHQCIGHSKWNGIRKKYCPELTEYFNKLKAEGKAGMKHLHTAAAKTVKTPKGTFKGVAKACEALGLRGPQLRKLLQTDPKKYYIVK
jgi:hypothetical protein